MNEARPRSGVLRTPESRFEKLVGFPWTPQYFDVEPGLRMAYVDTGPRTARETMVLLHGEPTWGYLYRKMIGPFEAAGFRVIVPDLIGFGRSDKPVDPAAYSYSRHVGWVTRLVEQLDLRGVTCFGQDWGGLIGARVVAEHESRFARAVFSNTGLPSKNAPSLPGLRAQERLAPETLKAMLGIDWRDTVGGADRIDPDEVHAQVRAGAPLYFLAWRVYSQEVRELIPSKIVPGWCLRPLSAEARAAYDAPFPTQEYVAGARRFPLLVPITDDDPERDKFEAAWAVYRRLRKPLLTLWGDLCPFTPGRSRPVLPDPGTGRGARGRDDRLRAALLLRPATEARGAARAWTTGFKRCARCGRATSSSTRANGCTGPASRAIRHQSRNQRRDRRLDGRRR